MDIALPRSWLICYDHRCYKDSAPTELTVIDLARHAEDFEEFVVEGLGFASLMMPASTPLCEPSFTVGLLPWASFHSSAKRAARTRISFQERCIAQHCNAGLCYAARL